MHQPCLLGDCTAALFKILHRLQRKKALLLEVKSYHLETNDSIAQLLECDIFPSDRQFIHNSFICKYLD